MIVFMSLLAAEGNYGEPVKKNSVTIGFLQGGGSLIGVDFERMLTDNLGISLGAGLVGVGGGLTWHFEDSVDSDSLFFGVWNQGIPQSETAQQVVGITYTSKSLGWLSGQIGLGYVFYRGSVMEESLKNTWGMDPPKVMLMYSIGYYFAF